MSFLSKDLKNYLIADFDCECRPLAWYGGDWVTKQPTAIAYKILGERQGVQVLTIGESYDTRKTIEEEIEMLMKFREVFERVDMVTGHYIRGFDLLLVNGALMRLGLPLLPDKLTHDTKEDLAKGSGISKSQENLGAMYELNHPKIPMNTSKWAEANMLMPEGIAETKKRVVGDVRQHIELREKMLRSGHLGSPKMWSAFSTSRKPSYHA